MEIATRLKRSAKELLGQRQWPKAELPKPHSYEEQLYASIVRAGDVCYDVGANIGEVSLFLARLAGTSGLVVAFEPVWPVYAELCRTIQADTYLKAPLITIPAGLSDVTREALIQVPDGRFGMGSMAEASQWSRAIQASKLSTYPARFLTLDNFIGTSALPKPTFIKIDVEGAELFVLHGASHMFDEGIRPIMLIELFAPWEHAFGYQPWEPLRWLRQRDYRLLFACPSGLVDYTPSPLNPFPPDYEMGYNVLAYVPSIHSERIAALRGMRPGAQAKLLPMLPPPCRNQIR